jgi:hypothetical protein
MNQTNGSEKRVEGTWMPTFRAFPKQAMNRALWFNPLFRGLNQQEFSILFSYGFRLKTGHFF